MTLVTLVLLGTDFRDSPLAKLDALVAAAPAIGAALDPQHIPSLQGGVVLATCNRFEIYLDVSTFHDSVSIVTDLIASHTALDPADTAAMLTVRTGDAAIHHLFSVAAGLESMVVGEEEIAGQVKRAWASAKRRGMSSKPLNALFQRAATVSKAVTRSTGLGSSGRSLITSALDLAAGHLGSLEGRRALLIGTGAYSRVVTAALQRSGLRDILVYSPSGRAERFCAAHDTLPVPTDGLAQALERVDLVVSASGSHSTVVGRSMVSQVLERGRDDALVIIDVALSRDVDPGVVDLTGVELIDLERIHQATPPEHHEAVSAARELVQSAVVEFRSTLATQTVDPVISALRSHVGQWVEAEVDRVRRRSGDGAAIEVERSLKTVTNALLHGPSVKAKAVAAHGDPDDVVAAVRLLFDIEVDQHA
ncbi:MAG TPA: glutamyl-tRNA reductase [Microbacteriaceae bacterium]|nr:glutamyl-tRNA reductase [Microbacteriaceae bacterium]